MEGPIGTLKNEFSFGGGYSTRGMRSGSGRIVARAGIAAMVTEIDGAA
jgi:hypothetical protein